jgi:gamma-glutamyltranspeptidase/glutathione hydrolase
VGHVTTYYGGAAAEEPHATLAGRDVLSAGGTAADAAVAMYFTLAVTLPSAAGLGGGGVCIYFDNAKSEARTLDFIARAPHPAPPGRWPAAVPGTVRGMFALQARYGRLRWEQLIQPAEALARFGVPASRALASVLQGAPVLSDPRAAREFGGAGGKGLAEGEMLRRVDLAGTLARIRAAGAGDFYNGALARSYVDGIAAIGGSVSIDDMRSYHPVWRETITGRFGSKEVHFPPSPVTGGRIAAAIWAKLGDNDAFSGLAPGARERVLVDTAREAYAGAWARPEAGGGSAGFIVMDREGSAAACTVSMNRPFGSGKMIPGMGFLAVRPPQDAATALLGMVPMVIANHNIKQAFMAATGAGDALAPVALMDSVLRATSGKTTVANAVAAPRAAPGARPDVTLVEQNAPPSIKQAFTGPGVKTTPSIGRVLMMYCPGGIYLEPRSCAVSADPRGFGYAVNAEQ